MYLAQQISWLHTAAIFHQTKETPTMEKFLVGKMEKLDC